MEHSDILHLTPADLATGDVLFGWTGKPKIKDVTHLVDEGRTTSYLVETYDGTKLQCNAADVFVIARRRPDLTIVFDPDDPYEVHVAYPGWGLTKTVDISPNPTHLSPVEVNDMLGEAVTEILDVAWEEATGQGIERDPEKIGKTFANHRRAVTEALKAMTPDDLIEVFHTALSEREDAEYTGRAGIDNWTIEGDGDVWDVTINPQD